MHERMVRELSSLNLLHHVLLLGAQFQHIENYPPITIMKEKYISSSCNMSVLISFKGI